MMTFATYIFHFNEKRFSRIIHKIRSTFLKLRLFYVNEFFEGIHNLMMNYYSKNSLSRLKKASAHSSIFGLRPEENALINTVIPSCFISLISGTKSPSPVKM